LAKAGLIAVTESKTCQRLWETFLQHKTGIKPKTVKAYNECRSHFFKPFSLTEPVEQITPERLQDWKASLLETHAVASVAGYIKNLGAVLRWAVKQKWLETNPLEGITRGSFVNREKDRIISMADYVKLLVACPNQEWRTIIALARIGGLRCPSELKSLRWSDVDWDKSRFVVKSPKTEQHDGKDKRVVPLFADLRSELKRQFDETKDSEFVIGSFQGTSWALSDAFQKIANAAGLGTIERPFDNLRTTRSNEVLERWGSAKESQWIGHSEAVMRKHYLLLPDEAFAEAADLDAENIHVKSHAKRT
jgi:integrase